MRALIKKNCTEGVELFDRGLPLDSAECLWLSAE